MSRYNKLTYNRKKVGRRPIGDLVSEVDKKAIESKIIEMCETNKEPSVLKLLRAVNADKTLPNFKQSAFYTLLGEINCPNFSEHYKIIPKKKISVKNIGEQKPKTTFEDNVGKLSANPVANIQQYFSIGKRGRRRIGDLVSESEKIAIQIKLMEMCECDEKPTITKLLKVVNSDKNLPNFKSSAFYKLLREEMTRVLKKLRSS